MKLQDLHPKNKRGNFEVRTPYFHTNNEIPQNPFHETPKYSKKIHTKPTYISSKIEQFKNDPTKKKIHRSCKINQNPVQELTSKCACILTES